MTQSRGIISILFGASPKPRDLMLYRPKYDGIKKGRAWHGLILRSPASALGLLPSIALSSEQVEA
jgi:hypothetical protein